MRKAWILRKASQPVSYQSAGRIFKNPRGLSAAALIEQAGLAQHARRRRRGQRPRRQLLRRPSRCVRAGCAPPHRPCAQPSQGALQRRTGTGGDGVVKALKKGGVGRPADKETGRQGDRENAKGSLSPCLPVSLSPGLRTARAIAPLAVGLLLLTALIILGGLAARSLHSQERYQIAFADLDCTPPPHLSRAAFLEEVQYFAQLPDSVCILDDGLPARSIRRLRAASVGRRSERRGDHGAETGARPAGLSRRRANGGDGRRRRPTGRPSRRPLARGGRRCNGPFVARRLVASGWSRGSSMGRRTRGQGGPNRLVSRPVPRPSSPTYF